MGVVGETDGETMVGIDKEGGCGWKDEGALTVVLLSMRLSFSGSTLNATR